MPETTRSFSYTRSRGAFGSAVAIILFLLVVESSVVVLLISVLAGDVTLRLTLLGAFALLSLWIIFGFLLAPLWTRHRLSPTHLDIRYGLDRLSVPRSTMVAAAPASERLDILQPIRAQVDQRRRRVVATFSENGQILLHLDDLYAYRVNGGTSEINQILFNADDPETLLASLALPASPISTPIKPVPARPVDTRPLANPAVARIDQTAPSIPNREGNAGDGPFAIRVDGLTRRYGTFTAVDGLTLAHRPGEIYGFLGPNGAGKSTTIRMLVGLLDPTSGRIGIAGHDLVSDPIAARSAMGYVADRAMLYERLSGREFLSFMAQMRAIPEDRAEARIASLLQMLELSDFADRSAGSYSYGMKRKLALAAALLHEPPVLILDEPLNGLDPRGAYRLKELFAELAANGTGIFLSTHDLAMAESVCDRVGIINRGRLLAEGRASDLRQMTSAPTLESLFLELTAEGVEVL